MKIRNWIRICAVVVAISAVNACGRTDPSVYVASAKEHIAKAEYGAAIIQLKNALKDKPDSGEVRFLLASALLHAGDPSSAATEARKALELRYLPDEVYPVLAQALVQQGEYKRTLELSGRELQSPQAKAEMNVALAAAYYALGDAKQSRRLVDAALAEQPDNGHARIAHAKLVAAGGDLQGSLKLVDAVLAAAPKDVDALLLKADLEKAAGRSEDARQTLLRIVEVKPALAAPRVALILNLLDAKEFDKAAAQLESIKKMAPTDPRTHYADALVAFSRGKFPEARDAVQKSRQGAPDYLEAQYLAGIIDYQLGNLPAAEESLRAVVSKFPSNDIARRMLAGVYLRRGRAAQALEVLEPALRRAPDNPLILGVMGEVYFALNDPARAAEYLDRSNKLRKGDVASKDNLAGRIRLAEVRMAAGESERAIKDLEGLAASQPTEPGPDLALITALMRKRDYDKALAAITALEQKQPSNPVGPNLKGIVYLAKGDAIQARASFERALALDPGYAAATFNLARVDLMAGRFDEARKRYDQLLAKDPKNEGYLLAVAEMLTATGAPPADIKAAIERAIVANPASARPRLALIGFHSSRRDIPAALAVAQAAQAALPDNPKMLEAVAVVQQAAGQLNQAIETLRRAARLQPENPAPLLRLAELQTKAKDYDGALATIRSALAIQRDNLELWSALAGIYSEAGRTDAGLKEARQLKQQSPKLAEGWLMEGDLLARQKKWPEAVVSYRTALERNPSTFVVTRLHTAQMLSNQRGDAAATAQRWLKDHPDDVAVRLRLGEQRIQEKDYPAAIAQLRLAVEVAPDNAAALNNLAWAQGQVGDPKAEENAARAYALAPNSSAVADTYGWILVQKGDAKRGAELLRKSVELTPNDPQRRLRLARAWIKAGDKAAARKELETAIEKAGEQPVVRSEAEKLLKEL